MKVIRALFASVIVIATLAAPMASAGNVCWDDGAGGTSPVGYKC